VAEGGCIRFLENLIRGSTYFFPETSIFGTAVYELFFAKQAKNANHTGTYLLFMQAGQRQTDGMLAHCCSTYF